jgi:protein-S-isoprenylcysteine O-methyltransferase Ste14
MNEQEINKNSKTNKFSEIIIIVSIIIVLLSIVNIGYLTSFEISTEFVALILILLIILATMWLGQYRTLINSKYILENSLKLEKIIKGDDKK